MAEIEIKYDRLGSRLRSVGTAVVEYDRLGAHPRRLGHLELRFDKRGVCAIGDATIAYNGAEPCTIGGLNIEYEQKRLRPKRPRRIGSWELEWERGFGFGHSLRTIGPLTPVYGHHWGPDRVIVPGEGTALDDNDLTILYFVLLMVEALNGSYMG